MKIQKEHSFNTLMHMNKKELCEFIMVLERNNNVLHDTIDQQVKNVADWEPVVRCKDCKREAYCECTQYQGENGYCSLGERKGD